MKDRNIIRNLILEPIVREGEHYFSLLPFKTWMIRKPPSLDGKSKTKKSTEIKWSPCPDDYKIDDSYQVKKMVNGVLKSLENYISFE